MTSSHPDNLYGLLERFLSLLMSMGESESMDVLIEMDLSFSQARTLFVLAQCCESVPIHEVAGRLKMSVASTGRNVDQLVSQGLVERREDPDDRRIRRVTLSDSGRAIVGKHVDAKRDGVRAFTRRLAKDDRARLAECLESILAGDSLQPQTSQEKH